MKILVSLTLEGRNAGIWYALETTRRLQARGHEVLCLPRPGGTTIGLLRDANLNVIDDCDLAVTSPKSVYRNIKRLIRLARDFQPDVILAHWGTDHIYWALAKTVGRLKTPLIRVRALDPRPPKKHVLSKWLHRKPTDHIVTVNTRLSDAYRTRLRLPRDRVSIIGPGVDPTNRDVGETADLTALGIPEGKNVVILLARFSPVKGHRVLLKTIRPVVERFPDIHFLWLGFPAEYDRRLFDRWFVEANLMECITVVDSFQPNVNAILQACTLALVTSVGSESISRSLLEYFSCGLPVVASDVGGVTDLMQRGEFGILVPPDDAAALAEGIIRILELPDRGQSLGARAHTFLSSHVTWDQRIDDWENLLAATRNRSQSP
ncbi:MAG: glycosyltransferase [candidate division Zixibacteria bacterium]|nr:glycosyltransferase [candidate division Zixibacteria bacterium]